MTHSLEVAPGRHVQNAPGLSGTGTAEDPHVYVYLCRWAGGTSRWSATASELARMGVPVVTS